MFEPGERNTPATQPQAAHHEAGHAIAAKAFGVTVNWIEIKDHSMPRHGLVQWLGETNTPDTTAEKHHVIWLAGGAGEALYNEAPDVFPEGCREDEWDKQLAALVDLLGDDRADQVQQQAWRSAKRLVALNQESWLSVARALIDAPGHRLATDVCAQLLTRVPPATSAAL